MTTRKRIWEYVNACGSAQRHELYAIFGDVRKTLHKMVASRHLTCWDGVYRVSGDGRAKGGRWTDAEIDVLCEYYAQGHAEVTCRLPHRTYDSVVKKANLLGLSGGDVRVQRAPDPIGKALRLTPVPAYTRGHLSPVVRACIAEAA